MIYRCFSRDLLRHYLSELPSSTIVLLPELCCQELISSCTLGCAHPIYYTLDNSLLPDLISIALALDNYPPETVVVVISVFNSDPTCLIESLKIRFPSLRIVFDSAISLSSYFSRPSLVDLSFTSPYKYFGSMPFSASSNITAHPYSDINYSNIFFIYFVYLIKLSLTFIRRLPLLLYPKSLITAFTYLPFISSSASQFSQTVDFRLTPLFTIELLLRLSLVFSATRCFQSFDIPLLSVNSPRASASCFLFLLSNKYLPPSSLLIHGFKLSPWPSESRNHISGGRYVYVYALCP